MVEVLKKKIFFFVLITCNLLNLEKLYRHLKKLRNGSYKIRDTSAKNLKTPSKKRLG